jgi:hypothetical protein
VKYPGKIDPGAAAREEEVIIELVFVRRRAIEGGALDRKYNRRAVVGDEYVTAEAIAHVFPAIGEALKQSFRLH